MGLRICRIKLNCSFQQLPSHRVVVLRARIDTGKRTHDTLPGVQAFRLLALCSYTLGSVKLRLNRCHYPLISEITAKPVEISKKTGKPKRRGPGKPLGTGRPKQVHELVALARGFSEEGLLKLAELMRSKNVPPNKRQARRAAPRLGGDRHAPPDPTPRLLSPQCRAHQNQFALDEEACVARGSGALANRRPIGVRASTPGARRTAGQGIGSPWVARLARTSGPSMGRLHLRLYNK